MIWLHSEASWRMSLGFVVTSGGSVGTTDQGKGKGRSVVRPMGTVAYRGKGQGKGKGRGEGRLGQGGRGRSKGGEKLMGTTAYGGKGSKGRAANGDRPVGAASCRRDHHTMASCQNPLAGPALWVVVAALADHHFIGQRGYRLAVESVEHGWCAMGNMVCNCFGLQLFWNPPCTWFPDWAQMTSYAL